MFRSKVKWFEQGEKPTKYFFNLEKMNYEKKLIREVKLENSETVTDAVQVKKEIEAFYQSLYTSKFGDKGTQVSNYDKKLMTSLKVLISAQLSEEEQEPLETELTLEELKDALASFVLRIVFLNSVVIENSMNKVPIR